MNFRLLAFFVALLLSVATAHAGFWRNASGNPVPDTDSRRTVAEFGGWLLVTSDPDWDAKWNTPAETIPNFNEAKTVRRGVRVFTLTFFANPKLDADHTANITCDLKVTRSNGTESINQRNAVCFRGRIQGSPYNMYLAAPVISFVGEADDPAGVWIVEVTLQDNLRRVAVPLKTTFTLE